MERPPHFSLFEDGCDPKKLLQAAKNTGIKIANITYYVGGRADGRAVANQSKTNLRGVEAGV